MPSWVEDSWASLDFETTSPLPNEARILQAALVVVAPDGSVAENSLSFLVNPGVEIPAEAQAVHGITAERVAAEGISPKDSVWYVMQAIWDFCGCGGLPLVIFNVPYDWTVFLCEARRQGVNFGLRPYFLDPLCLDRGLDRYRKGSRKLGDMAAYYGVPNDGAHDAKADAIAAVGVMRAMIQRWPSLGSLSLHDLQDQQRRWYEEWKNHLNEYWARTGKAERITEAWPGGLKGVGEEMRVKV